MNDPNRDHDIESTLSGKKTTRSTADGLIKL
jgi:hypothetical protein